MASEPFIVGYDRIGLRKVKLACLFGLLLFTVLTVHVWTGTEEGFNLRWTTILGKYLGPLIVVCLALCSIYLAKLKGPALVVDSSGLEINFLPGTRFNLPWTEIAAVSVIQQTVKNRIFDTLVIQAQDKNVLVAKLNPTSKLLAYLAVGTGQPLLGIGMQLLDRSREDIEEAVEEHKPFTDAEVEEIIRQAEAFQEKNLAARHHHGDLITLEDFMRVFR